MTTTRTYLIGCTWCNATGFVKNTIPEVTTPLTEICPVCNGAKTVLVTEVVESEPDKDELREELMRFGMKLAEKCMVEGTWKLSMKRFVNNYLKSKLKP